MRFRFVKKFLLLALIFVLLSFNFLNIFKYSVKAVNELANSDISDIVLENEKISWNAYFKKDDNKYKEIDAEISQEVTITVDISVKEVGSLSDLCITFDNANFQILGEKVSSPYIKEIKDDANQIYFQDLIAGNNITIDIPVEFKKIDNFSVDYFDSKSKVNFNCVYFLDENKQKSTNINSESNLILHWKGNTAIYSSQDIEKVIYIQNSMTIIQQNIELDVQDNLLPVKSQDITIEIPNSEELEKVEVIYNGVEIDSTKYHLDKNKVIIENDLSYFENKYMWGNSKSVYKIVYYYKNQLPEDTVLNYKTEITEVLFGMDNEYKEKLDNDFQANLRGDLVSVNVNSTENIKKGYLYSQDSKSIDFDEEYNVEISNIDLIKNLKLLTEKSVFIRNDSEYNADNSVFYKSTQFNKNQMLYLLGLDGYINIYNQNGELLQTITEDTETNENGQVIINYSNDVNNLIFEFSNPISIGNLDIKNKKYLKNDEYSKELFSEMNLLKTQFKIDYSEYSRTEEYNINLQEPEEKAQINISKTEFSSVNENKDLEIKAVLKTNTTGEALYKNPIVQIEFPAEVESINVKQINLLYEDELKIKSANLRDNTIEIYLEGEQTKYKDATIDGATISIILDLTINPKTISQNNEIRMTYRNQQGNREYSENTTTTGISIISPDEVITTNNIAEYGIETVGSGEEVIEIERNSQEKIATVDFDIINNKTNMQDIYILGKMPTQGEVSIQGNKTTNTMSVDVVTPIELSTSSRFSNIL